MVYKRNLNNKHNDIISGIVYGISYFSVLPFSVDYFNATKKFYQGVIISLPIIGLLLSFIIIAAYIVLPFSNIYSAFLASILYLFLTGFLHFEAVGDTIDGWYASYSNKDIYEVMHEPQIGSIGAIGMVSFMLLEISAVTYCLHEGLYVAILLSFLFSRVGVYFALDFKYHSKSILILSLKSSIVKYKFLSILFFPIKLMVNYVLTTVEKRIGFLNGDTLGFMIVIIEIILLNIGLLVATI